MANFTVVVGVEAEDEILAVHVVDVEKSAAVKDPNQDTALVGSLQTRVVRKQMTVDGGGLERPLLPRQLGKIEGITGFLGVQIGARQWIDRGAIDPLP
jgi:hypothetical protein